MNNDFISSSSSVTSLVFPVLSYAGTLFLAALYNAARIMIAAMDLSAIMANFISFPPPKNHNNCVNASIPKAIPILSNRVFLFLLYPQTPTINIAKSKINVAYDTKILKPIFPSFFYTINHDTPLLHNDNMAQIEFQAYSAVISHKESNRVGGGITPAVLSHHRTYRSVYGGSSILI